MFKLAELTDSIGRIWTRYAQIFLLLGCLFTPLKLSLTYIFFGPAMLGWLCANRNNLNAAIKEHGWFFAPWFAFVLSLSIHSCFGFYPWRSLQNIYSLLIYPIVLVAIADNFTGRRALFPLFALIGGQTVAGLHSILDTASSQSLPRLFIGAVSESGQLALVAPLACGLAVTLHRYSKIKLCIREQIERAAVAGLITALFCLAAFGKALFSFSSTLSSLVVGAVIIGAAAACLSGKKASALPSKLCDDRFGKLFRYSSIFMEKFCLPVLLAALVVNLKRGPWAGVLISFLLFSLIYSRKLVLPFLTAVFAIIIIAAPVQTRLLESSRDFFIPGGRSAIWKVGVEIAERFPLGIGFRNSKFLHSYSTEIPAELTHFHNNFINILVEAGPLTLILFVIWLLSIIRLAFTLKVDPILAPTVRAIGCALVAWQVAGMVEYNFGDSEVVFVIYILLGALAGIKKAGTHSH